MTTLHLKLLAILFMTLDHIGIACGCVELKIIGRLALPIFAFLIANGYRHTKNVYKYGLRLFAFAILSELPFDLFMYGKLTLVCFDRGLLPDFCFDNVFFTLFLGLAFLYANDICKKHFGRFAKLFSLIAFFVFGIISCFISSDYSITGVAYVAVFGVFYKENQKGIFPLCIATLTTAAWKLVSKVIGMMVYLATSINLSGIPGLTYFFNGVSITNFDIFTLVSAFSLVPILLYNGKSGMPSSPVAKKILQLSFYAYYPIHILILYFISKI